MNKNIRQTHKFDLIDLLILYYGQYNIMLVYIPIIMLVVIVITIIIIIITLCSEFVYFLVNVYGTRKNVNTFKHIVINIKNKYIYKLYIDIFVVSRVHIIITYCIINSNYSSVAVRSRKCQVNTFKKKFTLQSHNI